MMASHRPGDSPPAPPPEPVPPEAAATPAPPAPGGLTTLPVSNFLVGFDWVLAFGVVALAFLLASFAVRNPDFWMHLAAGRLLADGQYQFGVDPFSYTGAGRTWVNHAWLFDWGLYEVYRLGDGPAVVIVKAVALGLTAGLLLLARKPGQSVFPAVVCVGLALVAAAPRLLLQPTAVSFLFLAAFLCLLIRVPRRPGSWRFPILVGVLFCLWANCDQWFLLGPVALLLYTVGQYVRADEGEHVPSLWAALAIGVLATLANPHHVRVWVPPAEIIDARLAEAFGKDPEMADLFRGAFTPGAIDFAGERSNPANLYALVALIVLAAIGFAVNYRRASVGLALMFAGAVVLALVHLRAVPFLAFVAAPVAAVNLGAAGRRLADRPLPDGTIRVLHALRGGGRAAAGIVGLLAIVLSYPGWLHPFEQQRRWAWDVEPNQSLVRAAGKIREWRTSGTLPPEARLLNIQPDFANYVAWFAPGQKTFFDYRVAFHRDEAAEYAALRRYMAYRDPRKRRTDRFVLRDFLDRYKVTFAEYAPPRVDPTLAYLWGAENPDPTAPTDWALWDVQGRAVMFGYSRQRTIPAAAFDRLRFDPVREAYAADQPLAPPPSPLPPPVRPTDVWERFLAPPPAAPVDAEEALVLLGYGQTLLARAQYRHNLALLAIRAVANTRLMTPALSRWTDLQAAGMVPVRFPADVEAVVLLAARAARRAILASPDHPDGYYYLAQAYGHVGYHASGQMKEAVHAASLARARVRMPDDPSQPRPSFDVRTLVQDLLDAHSRENPPRLDLIVDVLKFGLTYLQYDLQTAESRLAELPADERDAGEAEVASMRAAVTTVEATVQKRDADVQRNSDRFVNIARGLTAATDRAAVARRLGLVREAINELRPAQEQFQRYLAEHPDQAPPPAEFAATLAAHAELIELLWYDGQVEESARILDTVDTPTALAAMENPAVRQAYLHVRQRAMALLFPDPRQRPSSPYDANPATHFRALRSGLSMIAGDFERAAEVRTTQAKAIGRALTEAQARNFPNGLPAPADVADFQQANLDMALRPVQAAIHFARREQARHFAEVRTLSLARSDEHLAIGLIDLEWGEVGRAIPHLRQAEEAPGWPDPLSSQRLARQFLDAIARARGGSP